MFRTMLCAIATLVLFAGTALTADKKAGTTVTGTLKKVDAATGSITVAVKNKNETTDKEFKINDATKVVINGADKKELTGKDGLKNPDVKEGAAVSVAADATGKVTMVTIGTAKKK